jgi:hypothetical protein
MAPDLKLNRQTGTVGLPLLNCVQFVDNSFAWGPVVTADIVLAGKIAGNVPIQVIADSSFNSLAAACSSGTAITTAKILGANGILGLGLSKEDCGSGCASVVNNGFYFTCTNETCTDTTGTTAATTKQVQNPVPLFASDNNGLLIDLPDASAAGASSLNGTLFFGVNTQTNNQWTSGDVLTTSSSGTITTLLTLPTGQTTTLNSSIVDTGSNGLYFDSATIPTCVGSNTGFYCPKSRTTLSATLGGVNGGSSSVTFSIDNALELFVGGTNAVLPTLSGPIGDAHTFDWGLPFFYGRKVFIGIEGQASTLGTGPYYAF